MSDEFQYDVFLSHSSKDKAVVRPLAERLREDGVKVWFDQWVLKPGDSIPASDNYWAQLVSGTFRFLNPLKKERRFTHTTEERSGSYVD